MKELARSRTVHTATYLEPPIAALVHASMRQKGTTQAAWLRQAVIEKLRKENRLTEETLLEIIAA